MPDGELHVLAVTDNASLVIGLTFAPREWHITSRSPSTGTAVNDLGDSSGTLPQVVVLDPGASRSLSPLLDEMADGQHAVVIADAEPEEQLPAATTLLLRPYTVDALIAAIDGALAPVALEQGDDPVVPGEGLAGGADNGGSAPEEFGGSDLAAPVPPPERTAVDEGQDDAPASGAIEGATADAEQVEDAPAITDEDADAADAPSRRGGRNLGARLFGRLVPLARSERRPDEGDATTPAPDPAEDAVGETPASEPECSDDDHHGDPTLFDDVVPAAEEVAAPDPPPAVVTHGPRTTPSAEATSTPVASPPAARVARWRARRQRSTSRGERALQERLSQVLTATGELEHLLADLPLLTDPPALARAIVGECAREFSADTAALWQRQERGWHVAGQVGFTAHEATWIVPVDQPLFTEVDQTGGAMLIDPIDAVPAAVAGIGGAHTRAFMAASVAIGPGRFGLLAVGRNEPLVEDDLEVLEALAFEIAPGMAVAEQLARLQRILADGGGSHPHGQAVPAQQARTDR